MNERLRKKFEERLKRRLRTEWTNYNKDGVFPNISLYPTIGRKNWYFVIHGLNHPDYQGGIYLGKMIILDDYPSKSPEYTFLTPNAFFAINEPIRLEYPDWKSNSSGFVEGLLYLKSLMLSTNSDKMTIHYKSTSDQRKMYAKMSIKYNKKKYNRIFSQCFPEIKLN